MAEDKNAKTGASRLGLSLKAKNGVFAVPGKKDVSRRWIHVLLGAIGLLIVVVWSMSKKATLPPPRKAAAPAINLTPTGMAQRSWEAQSQTQIQSLKDQNESLQATVTGLKTELSQVQQSIAAARNSGPPASGGASGAELPPPPPPPPPVPASSSVSGESGSASPAPTMNAPPLEGGDGGQAVPEGPYVFAPKPLADAKVTSSGEPAGRNTNALKTARTAKMPSGTGILLTGSFVKVALLNGVDAGTSSQTRSNPEPVLLRVQDNAVLPGSTHFRLRSCFMLGSAYGSLSSERVYIRLAELSCVDRHRKLVLSQPVRGYVVDSDSMLGLRGTVIDRQGAKIGKALLAGFAQGLANAFGGAQGMTTTSAIGTMSTITGSAAVKAAGLSGAASASSQLAQFYLQQAESIFPVIRVAGGRLATAVFTSNVPLEWGHVQGVTTKSSLSRGT
ncbi:MAG: TraB/VirB10 family protein [Steroidobacteraceae bacterium]